MKLQPSHSMRPVMRLTAGLVTALVLAGCASLSADGQRSAVAKHLEQRLPADSRLPGSDPQTQADAKARIAQWLEQPVEADTAVRIALLNNPGLQARLAELGIRDAERVRALTLVNPSLTFGRFTSATERELERQLSFGLIDIITLPWRTRWQGWQMEQATLTVAQQVLAVAADTRRAWLRAVAAQQVLAANERMSEAASLGAELASRMGAIGNFNKLEQAREIAAQQASTAALARARLGAEIERENLARWMGLWGRQAGFKLPEKLPALPGAKNLRQGRDAEATALRERLDLRALRRDLDVMAERHGVAGVNALFGDIGLTYTHNRSTERATGEQSGKHGWEVELPIPLFDWGGAARGRARAGMERSAALLRENAITARSEARTSWLRYRTAWDLAHQQQAEVLPLARQVQEETVYRYNGMFASVWLLLAQARATTQVVAAAAEAQRDFWLADTDLQLALTGTSPGTSPGAAAPLAAATSSANTNNESH
ncbi:copper resistance-related lipoprotein [Comamonas phosphati]|nr:copper resistance-related lipoprotein [Comamonas phosphati]